MRPQNTSHHSDVTCESERRTPRSRAGPGRALAFTIVELMIASAIVITLVAIAVPVVNRHLQRTLLLRTILDIRTIEEHITLHQLRGGEIPETLDEVDCGTILDPWGRPYRYANISTTRRGAVRKDRFLVPLNSDYDLYSVGKDGESRGPLTAKVSADDIIRANDGAFVGLAAEF